MLEALGRAGDRLDSVPVVRHVELHHEQPLGCCVERLLDVAGIPRRRDHRIAARQRESGDLEAEPA